MEAAQSRQAPAHGSISLRLHIAHLFQLEIIQATSRNLIFWNCFNRIHSKLVQASALLRSKEISLNRYDIRCCLTCLDETNVQD